MFHSKQSAFRRALPLTGLLAVLAIGLFGSAVVLAQSNSTQDQSDADEHEVIDDPGEGDSAPARPPRTAADWAQLMLQMKSDFDKAKATDGGSDTVYRKIDAWNAFLQTYGGDDNPGTAEYDAMWVVAQGRVEALSPEVEKARKADADKAQRWTRFRANARQSAIGDFYLALSGLVPGFIVAAFLHFYRYRFARLKRFLLGLGVTVVLTYLTLIVFMTLVPGGSEAAILLLIPLFLMFLATPLLFLKRNPKAST